MRTFAIVVNWNGGEDNLACLASLFAEGFEAERVVFVDNGSRDGSLERVRAAHSGLRVVEQGRNTGFGEASNAGARVALEAGAEALLFVNNDATLEPGCLRALEAELATGAALVGPRIVFADRPGVLWAAGGALTWTQNLSTLVGNGEADGPRFSEHRDVDYVPGCVLLATRAAWEALGGFDADYFAYLEDVDLGARAKELGLRSRLCGSARARHGASRATGGGYSARRKYLNALNSVRFLRRHGDAGAWLRFLLFDVLTLPPLLLVGLLTGDARAVLAKALGLLHGLAGRRVRPEQLEPGASRLW